MRGVHRLEVTAGYLWTIMHQVGAEKSGPQQRQRSFDSEAAP